MTVLFDGRVLPDQEFPEEIAGYHADRNSVHDFGTPFKSPEQVVESVEHLKADPQTYRLRVARYRLVSVEEIDCAGERP